MKTSIRKRNGQYFNCPYCKEEFYGRPSHVLRGIIKTCGKRECISQSAMGENNAFWGKEHPAEMREKLSTIRRSRPRPDMRGDNNPMRKGGHTPEGKARMSFIRKKENRPSHWKKPGPESYVASAEARAKISVGLREDWRVNRDKRLEAVAKARETQIANRLNKEPRYRVQFTPMQRRDWKADQCLWCDSTEELALDHILPVMAGGTNIRENSQTLCRRCNMWKMRYIDKPLLLAILASKGAT